jgi:hypothetical protein
MSGEKFATTANSSVVLQRRHRIGAQIAPDEPVTDPREAEQRAVAWLQTGGL